MEGDQLLTEDDLVSACQQTPAWTLRVTLEALRAAGWTFEQAWYSACQRLRVQPNMTPDEAEELIEFKGWFEWAKPVFEWAYNGGEDEPPQLLDGEVFTGAELAAIRTERRSRGSAPRRSKRR